MSDHGARLAHVLDYTGMTQAELAGRVGVKQPVISAATRSPRINEPLLARIALVTGYSPAFFDRLDALPSVPVSSVRFRKFASASTASDRRLRAHLRHAIEVIRFATDRGVGFPQVRIEPVTIDAVDVEAVAIDLRYHLRIDPEDPINNVTRAVERAGVVVIGSSVAIDEKHSGASVPALDAPPVIAVSAGMSGDRIRFTVAHELGHIVLHDRREVDIKAGEEEAHRFAGAFLVPRDALLEFLGERAPTLLALAHAKARFGVSISALIRRSLDLGLIDRERRRSLEIQLSSRGWRTSEPVDVPAEAPQLLGKAVAAIGGWPVVTRELGLPPMARRELLVG